jgi:hypothetical protein
LRRLFNSYVVHHRSTHGSPYKNGFGLGSPALTKTGESACRTCKVPDAYRSRGYSGLVRPACRAAYSVRSEFKSEPDPLCCCDVSVRGRLGHSHHDQKQSAIGRLGAIHWPERRSRASAGGMTRLAEILIEDGQML